MPSLIENWIKIAYNIAHPSYATATVVDNRIDSGHVLVLAMLKGLRPDFNLKPGKNIIQILLLHISTLEDGLSKDV